MIKSRMENDACWPKPTDTVEYFERLETLADQISDDLWLVEVGKRIREATDILKKSNDEAES